MCLKVHCRTYDLLPYGSDEFTEVYGKWADNVLAFYGYNVNCKRSIDVLDTSDAFWEEVLPHSTNVTVATIYA